jgi:glycosyltransferase involved in cell wall biosynthesis
MATASEWVMREVIHQGYPPDRISVIYPGAHVDEFRMKILPDIGKLRITYAGILLPYKGPHVLVNALKRLYVKGIDFSCSMAGSTTDKDYINSLKNFIISSGMEQKIRFNGFLDREGLKNLYATHNILVFPTIVDEAFGISQVEAMAAGLTVVSSGTGGAKEIIEHEKSGIIFRSKDENSLAEELLNLLNNPAKWKNIAETGQQRALDRFDIERSVDILEERFSYLINNNP